MSALSTDLLRRAFALFIEHAYATSPVPENRRQFVDIDPEQTVESLLQGKGVEKLPAGDVGAGTRYALRIGNSWYPNMKMIVSGVGAGETVIFSVDTHDRFDLPANSPEAEAIRELQNKNIALARAIEAAWEKADIPTQAGLLRRFLSTEKSPESKAT